MVSDYLEGSAAYLRNSVQVFMEKPVNHEEVVGTVFKLSGLKVGLRDLRSRNS